MKKIIITGSSRSGTTALTTLLSLSKKILVMYELGLYDANPNNFYNRKDKFFKTKPNKRFLKEKNLSQKDIIDFYKKDFRNKGDLEFFGDKWPTYCTSLDYCKHLIENHSDAYFIFTYRNPCAIINSHIKRTKYEPEAKIGDWIFKSIEENTNQILRFTRNWACHIYPHVKNKIIIDYDYYVNNVNLLINDLSKFLNTTIEINDLENTSGHTESFDTGFRGLYEHPEPNKYKKDLTPEQINFISCRSQLLDRHIKKLINKQQTSE